MLHLHFQSWLFLVKVTMASGSPSVYWVEDYCYFMRSKRRWRNTGAKQKSKCGKQIVPLFLDSLRDASRFSRVTGTSARGLETSTNNRQKRTKQQSETKCSATSLLLEYSGVFVLLEILKWRGVPLSSCRVFLLRIALSCMSLMLQRARGILCFQGCLVQKPQCRPPNTWLFVFPLQSRELEHDHHHRPASVRRIEINQLCVFHHSWHKM